jgi:hypothetical protein
LVHRSLDETFTARPPSSLAREMSATVAEMQTVGGDIWRDKYTPARAAAG